MEFKARPITENVNVTKGSRLWDMTLLVSGVFASLLVLFLVAGLLVDAMVGHVPVRWEEAIGTKLVASLEVEEDLFLTRILERLQTELPEGDPNASRHFRIGIIDNDQINAVAIPGDLIVIFSGLMDEVGSENELAMIIGHEMGHFANRDHLTRMGRALVFGVASRIVLGDAVSSKLTAFFTNTLHANYSRNQESAADTYGIHRLVAAYGHAGGAVDFFDRVAEQQQSGKLAHLVASHPYPGARSKALTAMIRAERWDVGPLLPAPKTKTKG